MNVDLAALIPNEDQIDSERLQSVLTKLTALLRDQYPDMDVSPNSVFYDNVLRPVAYILAGSEQSLDCVLSDLDLANVAAGNICNCDFVKAYLRTLGATINADIPSIATVRLSYATDVRHTVQNSARFVFADNITLRPLTALAGDIIVEPYATATELKTSNVYRLNRAVDGSFFVDLPVYGATDAELGSTGSTATTDVTDSDLVSVSLISPLVPFTEPETVQELAQRAQQAFPSSSLTTRSSAVSFFTHKFSNLAGVSAVMPGDTEMTRGGANLFGVQRNAVDIYPKGQSYIRSGQAVISLSKDTVNSRWCGNLNLPHVPIQIRSIVTLDGSALAIQKIVGASTNTTFPGLSAAFSQYEELGLEIATDGAALDDEISIGNVGTDFSGAGQAYAATVGTGAATLTGFYESSVFGSPTQKLKITDTNAGTFTLTNRLTGEEVTGMTLDAGDLDLTTGDKPHLAARWLGGLTTAVTGTALNSEINLDFEAEQGRVLVTYDYDPFLNETVQLLEHETLAGAFDIAVIAPRPLILDTLKIEYRTELGRWVDTGQALTDLVDYINQAVYPDNLEDSRISDIILFAGARGVRAITKAGTLYATLATHYSTDRVDAEGGGAYLTGVAGAPGVGEYQQKKTLNWVNEPSESAVTLDNADNLSVIGPRNVQYVLDTANITLVEYRN